MYLVSYMVYMGFLLLSLLCYIYCYGCYLGSSSSSDGLSVVVIGGAVVGVIVAIVVLVVVIVWMRRSKRKQIIISDRYESVDGIYLIVYIVMVNTYNPH